VLQKVRTLDAMNTGQAAVTWLSGEEVAGTPLRYFGDLSAHPMPVLTSNVPRAELQDVWSEDQVV
jgi:hypothetical protein